MKKTIFLLITIALIGAAIYSNSLSGEFVSDDYKHVVYNTAIKDIGNINGIWHSFNTRFLPGLTFAFNYRLGGLDSFGYHLFNVMAHILVAFLLFFFVRITFQTPQLKNSFNSDQTFPVAFFSAVLFLCHPVHTQSVSFITQRFALLATVFYLLTILCYVKGRLSGKVFYFIASYAAMYLGCFSKAIIVTVPVTLVVYELFFFEKEKMEVQKRWLPLIPLFLGVILFVGVWWQNSLDSVTQMKYVVALDRFDWNYVATEINVFRTYLRLFILPVRLTHNYCYPAAQGFFEISTVLSSTLLLGLVGLGVFLFKRNRLMSFCIMWFFITTSVEAAAVVFGNRGVIYENWLYLPTVGFAVFIVLLVELGLKNKRVSRFMLSMVIIVLCAMTYQRNKVWQNQLTLWEDVVRKQPQCSYHHITLADVYASRGDFDKSEKQLEESVQYDIEHTYVYANLGNFYFKRRKFAQAIEQYEKILSLNPKHFLAHLNMGRAYYFLKEYELAQEYILKAKKLNSDDYLLNFALGDLYFQLGNLAKAKKFYQLSIQHSPNFIDPRYQLGNVYLLEGDYPQALAVFAETLRMDPENGFIYNAMGVTYMKMGGYQRAEKHFLKALSLRPESKNINSNLVKYYKGVGDQAKADYYAKRTEELTED